MEADSQISGNKTIENKSILSFNYVYKKIILKESYENTISKLRALNYEKIAKYKMKNMNLKLLLNSIFKLKNTIKRNNPLLKYIKNVKPYTFPFINNTQNTISIRLLNQVFLRFPAYLIYRNRHWCRHQPVIFPSTASSSPSEGCPGFHRMFCPSPLYLGMICIWK